MAHTLTGVDDAWIDKLRDHTLRDGTPIEVFIEEPSPEEVPARVFPSISVKLIAPPGEDAERLEGDADEVEVGVDASVYPPVSLMGEQPIPYTLLYSVETWAENSAAQDRELQSLIATTLKAKAVLYVDEEPVWAFLRGMTGADERDGDRILYHKVYTYEVLVELAPSETRRQEQAVEIGLSVMAASPDGAGGLREGDTDVVLIVEPVDPEDPDEETR